MWLLGLFIAICVFCSIFCSYYELKDKDTTDNDDSYWDGYNDGYCDGYVNKDDDFWDDK